MFLGEVGFFVEYRWINVVIIWVWCYFVIVVDLEIVSYDGFFKFFVEYMSSEGEVRFVYEYF